MMFKIYTGEGLLTKKSKWIKIEFSMIETKDIRFRKKLEKPKDYIQYHKHEKMTYLF